jgi:DNA-binding YbaB/EbfC family protein
VSFGNMAKMAQQMQAEMARVQAELDVLTMEGTAGGGAVTATVNGHGELISLAIAKDVVDPDDIEMLQDLITAAVNDGIRSVKQTAEQKMARVTGGLRLPGMG